MRKELDYSGSVVVCSSPNGRGIFKYASYLSRLADGRLVTCRSKAGWYVAWEMLGILRYVQAIRLADEVIFANTRVSPLLWLVLDWRKVTVVVHDVMDTTADKERRSGISAGRRFAVCINSWIMLNSVNKAQRVIFNSHYTRSRVEKWLKKELWRTAVIFPPPSFAGQIHRDGIEMQKTRREGNLPTILVVTGMTKNKMYGDYKQFHKGLQKEYGGRVRMIIYGVSLVSADAGFRQWINESEGLVEVKFRREVRELMDDYLNCSLLCSLSIEEGYGMPVADALGFGIPVVARAIGAYEEIKREIDAMGLLKLGRDVDECVREAAQVIVQYSGDGNKRERIEKYKDFCARSDKVARCMLIELSRKGQ